MIENPTENQFRTWLETHGYPYLYIDQDKETFASFFADRTKRPDFLVLIESIGLIAVDVKTRLFQAQNEMFEFEIHEEDLTKLFAFELRFKIPVWVVISNRKQLNNDSWIWINAFTASFHSNSRVEDDKRIITVSKEYCKYLKATENLSKLFE